MDTGGGRTRVLWLTKGLGPGGAERLLLSFAQAGDHDRFAFHAAYLLPEKYHLVDDLEAAGVTVHCLGSATPWDLRWLWRLRRVVLRERIDVVHHHSPLVAGQARLVLRTIPRCRRPRSITTEHNLWSSHHRLTRLLNRVTIGSDDHVFAVSDQVRASMAPAMRDRAEVLIHGVDVAAIAARRGERAAARAEHGFTDDDFVVVTVANLRANKDYPTMLRAARQLVDDGVPVTFVSVGQGPLESELHALRDELGLGDRFRFLGYQADPIRVLAAGDAFCLSSRYEGLPIALLEALAMGLPVVATAVGGVPTALEHADAARLVRREDADGLRTALAEIALGVAQGRPSTSADPSAATTLHMAIERQMLAYLGRTRIEGSTSGRAPARTPPDPRTGSTIEPDPPPARSRRVLHVLASNDRRGAEVFACDLADALDEMGFESTVVSVSRSAAAATVRAEALGDRLDLRTLRSLRSLAKDHDVVLAHGSRALQACALACAGAAPFIYRSIGDPSYWSASGLKRRQVTLLLNRAHTVVTLFDGADRELRARGVRTNLVTIPRGVPVDRFPAVPKDERKIARSHLQLPAGRPVVLYLGALSVEKRPDRAIALAVARPDWQVLIVGDGPLLGDVERSAATLANVTVQGPTAEPETVLAAADVLILPSDTEGTPGVAIEAGLREVPVVASAVGGVATVVLDGRTGFLVPRGDIDALVHAVEMALSARQVLGTAARLHCVRTFDIERVTLRWVTVLESAMATASPTSSGHH